MFVTLMYHLIEDGLVNNMSVPTDSFNAQLAVFADMDVTLLRLADAEAILDGKPPPDRGLLITFDDGYLNTTKTALNILEEHEAPAAISLCSTYLKEELRPVNTIHASRDFASVNDIERWIASGRAIAGHSVDHQRLTDLPESEVVAQIADDKRMLQETFAQPLSTFVYPFGAVDERVERITGRFYRNAFTDSRGSWPTSNRRLAIRRLQVRPEWAMREFREQIEKGLAACVAAYRADDP